MGPESEDRQERINKYFKFNLSNSTNNKTEAEKPPQTKDSTRPEQSKPDVLSENHTYHSENTRTKEKKTTEASTQIDITNDVENSNDLPPELRLEAFTQYVNTAREDAKTFVLVQVNREKSHDGKSEKEHIHFRMEADLNPEWLIYQQELKRQSEETKKKALSETAWPKYTRGKLRVPKKAYNYGPPNKRLENIKNRLNAPQKVKIDEVANKKQLKPGLKKEGVLSQSKRLPTQGPQKTLLKKPDNSKIDTRKAVKPDVKSQMKSQTGKQTKQNLSAGKSHTKNAPISKLPTKILIKSGNKTTQAIKQNPNTGKASTKITTALKLPTKNLKNIPPVSKLPIKNLKNVPIRSGPSVKPSTKILASTKNAAKPVVKVATRSRTKPTANTASKILSNKPADNKLNTKNVKKVPEKSNIKSVNSKGNPKAVVNNAVTTKQKPAVGGHGKTLGTKETKGRIVTKPAGAVKVEKVTKKNIKQPVIALQNKTNKTALKSQTKSSAEVKNQPKQMNVKEQNKQESKNIIKNQQATKTNKKEDKISTKKQTAKIVIKEPVKPAPTKQKTKPVVKVEPPVPKKREEKKVEPKLESSKKLESKNKISDPGKTKIISVKPNIPKDGPQIPVERKEEKIVSLISEETQTEVETEKNNEVIEQKEIIDTLSEEITEVTIEEHNENKIEDTEELIVENNNTDENIYNNLDNNLEYLEDSKSDTITRETTNISPEEHVTLTEDTTRVEQDSTQVTEQPLEPVTQVEVESSEEITGEVINVEIHTPVQEQSTLESNVDSLMENTETVNHTSDDLNQDNPPVESAILEEESTLEETNVDLTDPLLENLETVIPTSNDLSQNNPPVEPSALEAIVAVEEAECKEILAPVVERTPSPPRTRFRFVDIVDLVLAQMEREKAEKETYKEPESPKPHVCNKCGYKVTEYIEKDTEETDKINEEEEIKEHELCQDCGITIIKEIPSSNECINCQGVFGRDTKFELQFDVISKNFVTLCLICKSPLGIMQKTRRRPPVPMRLSRGDVTPAFTEIMRRWEPARDAAVDGVLQYDPSELYTTSYVNEFQAPPPGPPVRPPPPSKFPKRPRFLHKAAHPQDYRQPPTDYKLEEFHGRRKFSGLGYVR